MTSSVSLSTIYNCTLERAFKTPMLCDVAKVHTGFWIMPAVTHCLDDENWGKVGSTKRVFVAKSLIQKGGEASIDKIIERIENEYWKIEVSDFKFWMLSFYKFEGTWKVTKLAPTSTRIDYSYTMYSSNIALYPLNWLFTNFFWKKYMKQVLKNIQSMAEGNEPYMYTN